MPDTAKYRLWEVKAVRSIPVAPTSSTAAVPARIPATEVDPKIEFLGRGGGWYPKPKELLAKILEIAKR